MTRTRRWLLLSVVAAALLLITLDNSILYTALPTLTEELSANGTESLWIINAYPLVMAGLLLGSGTLGDRVGHTRMFLIGLVIFGAASVLAAFSPTALILILARALLAVGAAAMMPATLALIRVTFTDSKERNFAIAVWGSISVIGMALGPILSGLLLEAFWWGSVFLINVPVVVVAFVAASLLAPKDTADRSRSWDLVSSIYAMVGLVGTVVAIKEFGHLPPNPIVIAVALLAAVTGFTLFTRRQGALEHPLLDFSIFRNRAFVAGLLGAGLSLFAVAGLQLTTTQRLQLLGGFSPLEAGLFVAALALGSLPTSLLGGAYLHRIGLLPLISGGMLAASLGVLWAFFAFDAGGAPMVGALVLVGAGVGAAMAVASTAIVGNVPVHRAGMASSVEEVAYEFGSLTAVAVLGSTVAALFSASMQSSSAAPTEASEGLAQAVDVAARSGQEGALIMADATTAYDGAYAVVLVIVATVLLLGSTITGVLLKHHGPGSEATVHDSH